MRYLTGALILLATGVACSRAPERTVADIPTAPTAMTDVIDRTNSVGGIGNFGPGVSGKFDVAFPALNETLLFRNALEQAYQTVLGRAATSFTAVDKEGEAVWIQEYIRYRVNGCDHGTAVQRVADQIANRPAGGVCGNPPQGLVLFPSRADVYAFRLQLEQLYQQVLLRVAQATSVDMEGASIWIAEYLRYRVNECDHAAASQKTLVQLQGAPPPDTCFVPCSYAVSPRTVDVPRLASTQSAEVRPNRAGCAWTAASDVPWLTFPSIYGDGNTFAAIPVSVATNGGPNRTGHIVVSYTGGTQTITINQAGTPFGVSFVMFDNARSTATPAEDCQIRTASNTCSFTATASMPGSSIGYNWSVAYNYAGTTRVFSQFGPSPNFAFSDMCGLSGSSAEGNTVLLEVTLVVTDEQGNSVTIQAGIHQPPLYMRLYTC